VILDIHSEIDALRRRIAKAEAERDTWRTAGRQENYLEAYSMVEALETQLDQRGSLIPAPSPRRRT
jgi:hypothetical protein